MRRFKVKRKGKSVPVQVRFTPICLPTKSTSEFQDATVCILEFEGKQREVFSGVALLHPQEPASGKMGMRCSFDRAVNAFVDSGKLFDFERKRIKKILWDKFIEAYGWNGNTNNDR